jgi:predicted metal-dependent hydrolase
MTHDRYSITINGEPMPVIVRKRRGARRFVIRYQPLQHSVGLTLPPYASIRQGLRFAQEKSEWIAQRMNEKPPTVSFADGAIIPILGKEYTLCHVGGRGVVKEEGDKIIVPGDAAFMPRRVRDFLKAKAREEITKLSQHQAERLGKKIKKISLRDTSSRWGSCSHDGNLSFSWRLVLAPYAVLEYLVSHEVAHLQEHNHSPAFWALVAKLFPAYEQAQQWLSEHGQRLYSYG